MLFVYVCADNYLRDGGRLGFVITQTVFKTKGAGDGFRRLKFGTLLHPVYLHPLSVAELSEVQVFEGATNRTAIFVCEKQKTKFAYPVPYTVWRGPGRIAQEQTREAVLAATTRHAFGALPVSPELPNSPWLTAPPEALLGISKVIGPSKYKAYAGCCTWMNGVYWIDVKQKLPNGDLLIENLWDVGKIKVEAVQTVIEADLVYPLLRGRDVRRWQATPAAHIILAQDPESRTGIAESVMKRKYPKTYAYLKKFEEELRGRSGFRKYYKSDAPFYSMYNVGPQSLSETKTAWCDMGLGVRVAATNAASEAQSVTGKTPIMGPHSMYVSTGTEGEAQYLEVLLNSAVSQLLIASYGMTTGTTTHVVEHVAIPRFQPNNKAHQQLADLSERCHQAAAQGDTATLATLQAQVDQAAAQLWGISGPELGAIQQALEEMRKVKPGAKGNSVDEADEEEIAP